MGQRILFLQKFCSLNNFLCTFNFFSNQERLFFADILFSLKSKIAAAKARLKNEREERIKMEEKVKYTEHVLWGIVVLLTKLLFNFSTQDFLMHRSYIRGNYDCEPLLGIYPDSQLGSSLHLALGHVLKFYNNFEILYKTFRSFLMAT